MWHALLSTGDVTTNYIDTLHVIRCSQVQLYLASNCHITKYKIMGFFPLKKKKKGALRQMKQKIIAKKKKKSRNSRKYQRPFTENWEKDILRQALRYVILKDKLPVIQLNFK